MSLLPLPISHRAVEPGPSFVSSNGRKVDSQDHGDSGALVLYPGNFDDSAHTYQVRFGLV